MKSSHLLVCLDLSSYDKVCIKQAITLASKLGSITEITFMHNIKFDFLNNLEFFKEEQLNQLISRIKIDIESKIADYRLALRANTIVCVTSNASTVDAIYSKLKGDSTIVIMGLKKSKDGKAMLPIKLLQSHDRLAPLILFPKGANLSFEEILISSQLHELKKYKAVLPILEQLSSNIKWLKIIKNPITYFPYLNIESEDIKVSSKEIVDSNYVRLNIEMVTKKSHNVADAILSYAEGNRSDLLVMARNESKTSAKLLGSNVLKVIQQNEVTPMLIV